MTRRATPWPLMALVLVLVLVLGGRMVQAQALTDGFDRTERKIVQTALALAGDYDGLVDGDFGQRSRAALDAYLARTPQATRTEAFAALLRDLGTEWHRFDWGPSVTPNRVVHFIAPARTPPGGGISVNVTAEDDAAARSRHDQMAQSHSGPGAAYQVRRETFLVTAAELVDGGRVYVRSDRRAGGFDTLVIIADEANRGRLQMVASSVTGAAPPELDPFSSPRIAALIGPRPEELRPGLRVGPDLVLTVGAEICAALTGPGGPAQVVARDAALELALVRLPQISQNQPAAGGVLALFAAAEPSLGATLNLAGARAEVVAQSSPLLSIGPADVLAATQARPGEVVLRTTTAPAPGTPVLTEGGALVGIVLRTVAAPGGALAVSASLASLRALMPEQDPAPVPGSPDVTLTCVLK